MCFYVIGKIEIYHYHTLTLQFSAESSMHLKGIHTQLKCQGFVLGDKGKATNLCVCGPQLATVYPNFSFVLAL